MCNSRTNFWELRNSSELNTNGPCSRYDLLLFLGRELEHAENRREEDRRNQVAAPSTPSSARRASAFPDDGGETKADVPSRVQAHETDVGISRKQFKEMMRYAVLTAFR